MANGMTKTEANMYTSHSLKATSLSWAAKAGLPMSVRRALGGHIKKDEVTPRAYSRDELAAPLRRLAAVYADIRCGVFVPDSTRSGMIMTPAGGDGEGGGDKEDGEGELPAEKARTDGGTDSDESDGTNGSDSDGTRTSSPASTSSSDSGAGGFVTTAGGVVKHVAVDGGKTACGRLLGEGLRSCRSDVPVCRLCTAAAIKIDKGMGATSKRRRIA